MATFDKAVRYEVQAVTVTPLRTGPADGSAEQVLRHRDGQAFLQASSLAGALHDWLARQDAEAAQTLFGWQEHSGQLYVSDAAFGTEAEMQVRPRLRLNGRMGSADDGGKFDTAHIACGSKLHFTLTWLGKEADSAGLHEVERMLSALHTGEICLGAQKTNGFGRVTLEVGRRIYHMTDETDRTDWLNDAFGGSPLPLAAESDAPVYTFTVRGTADSILIKDSAPRVEQNGKKTIAVNITENGRAIIPGSSIKGAVRGRVQMIAVQLGCSEEADRLFGRGAAEGDNGRAGRVCFEDAVLEQPKKREISRIRINRFTGGVMNGALFTEEPLSGTVTFRLTAPLDNARGCALLAYALRDLGLGLYNLGSGGAVGRGWLKAAEITVSQHGRELARMTFDEDGCRLDDPQRTIAGWLQTLEENA